MQDFNKALEEIKAILPKECISTERDELITHGSSGWTYHDPKVLPGAVLFPRHTDDVSGSWMQERDRWPKNRTITELISHQLSFSPSLT